LKDAADARYTSTGHLVFMRRGVMFAVPFDAERLEIRGAAVPVLDLVRQALTGANSADVTGAGQFAIAPNGTLAALRGPVEPFRTSALVTVDRRGRVEPLAAPSRSYGPAVRLSPDARHIVVTVQSLTEVGLWRYDIGRGTLTPLSGDAEVMWPIWAPDGRRLVFEWRKDGKRSLAVQPADGTVPPQVLLAGSLVNPSSWTPDGRRVVAVEDGTGADMVVVSVENPGEGAQPILQTTATELWPELSPDGRWLAYGSNVSGRFEVYVRPYPGPGTAEQVSIEGGESPAWHSGGRELFFVGAQGASGQRAMLSVEFEARPTLRIGRPRLLFEFDPSELRMVCNPVRCYDVAPDGQRFYATQAARFLSAPAVTHIDLVPDFFEELKAKVPASGEK
jgi:serine/threonine-protein kinase